MLVKVLLIKTAIGDSLCHYSIISRLSSIYGTSDAWNHILTFALSTACESSREFFIANSQTN